ncbi:MAG: RidA family protein [Chlamydiales bacterium]
MHKIETENAPAAIGPYSQAISAGEFLFISGQIPLDPKTGKLAEADIGTQTRQVLSNLQEILHAAELSWNHVVKTEVFMKDLSQFKEMNAIYAEKFPNAHKPARQTIQAAKLPMDALIEISCIAMKKG